MSLEPLIYVILSLPFIFIFLIYKRRRRVKAGMNALLRAHKNPFDLCIKEAQKYLLLKDYNLVIAIADQILEVQSNNHVALYLRGLSLEALNFNLDSIEDFEKLFSINKLDANTTGLLGLTYKKIGEFQKGQDYLKKSIEMGSDTYEISYKTFLNASPIAIELYNASAQLPKNLLRRNKKDFEIYLMNTDIKAFVDGLEKYISNLELGIKTYGKEDDWLKYLDKSILILSKMQSRLEEANN